MGDSHAGRLKLERGRHDSETLPSGTELVDHVIKDVIASSDHGTVYSGLHRDLQRPVAIKVLSRHLMDSSQTVQRFMREVRAIRLLGHPNTVDIYEFGKLPDGRPYYVLEPLEGVNLNQLVHRAGRLPPLEVLGIFEPLCAALQAAHDAGVIHRALAVGNIVVTTTPFRKVKLLDFGVANLIHSDEEAPSVTRRSAVGSAAGMAPEQFHRLPADPRTDIYSLGVILYRLLTGQAPFRTASREQMKHQHLTATPVSPNHLAPISVPLAAVILRCLEKQPDRRYQSAKELIAALRRALDGANLPKVPAKVSSGEACAILVQAHFSAEALSESRQHTLTTWTSALEQSQQFLVASGFALPLVSGNGLLAVWRLSDEPTQNRIERSRVVDAAIAVWKQLRDASAESPLPINVCIHADQAVIQLAGGQTEVIGGAILCIGAWAPRKTLVGPHSTFPLADDEPLERTVLEGRAYFRWA